MKFIEKFINYKIIKLIIELLLPFFGTELIIIFPVFSSKTSVRDSSIVETILYVKSLGIFEVLSTTRGTKINRFLFSVHSGILSVRSDCEKYRPAKKKNPR